MHPAPPGPAAPPVIAVHGGDDGRIVVLSVRGAWDAALRRETFVVLRRCLAARPAGLIIDLTALQDHGATSARIWTRIRLVGAGIRPPVAVALCVRPEAALADRLQLTVRTDRLLPVYARPHQARAALHNRIAEPAGRSSAA